MRPVIGITCRRLNDEGTGRYLLARPYVSVVEKAGGIPVLLPPLSKPEQPLRSICQGLILSGGGDPDPALFNEAPHPKLGEIDRERDDWEIFLCRAACEEGIPLLGICRGLQIMNIALGGDIYQDISEARMSLPRVQTPEHMQSAPPEEASHRVFIEEESLLSAILKRNRIWCNSLHHQAVRKVAPQLKAVAWSEDGVIEAVEPRGYSRAELILGLQWHPERLAGPLSDRIFSELIDSSARAMQLYGLCFGRPK